MDKRLFLLEVVCLAVISLVLAMPAGGFLFGFFHTEGGDVSVVARVVGGMVFTVLTPLSLGFPPRNEGLVGEPYNAWPYILAAGGVMLVVSEAVLLSLWVVSARRKKSEVLEK